MKKIGILTGGGDCPGLNAVIRAVVKKSAKNDWEVIGILDGWKGLIEGNVMPLTDAHISGILPKGGTILGTSRTNPFKDQANVDAVLKNFKRFKLDALIVIGGEDTLGVALKLHKMGVPVVGVPKTIDNDICGTDYTFGFDTARASAIRPRLEPSGPGPVFQGPGSTFQLLPPSKERYTPLEAAPRILPRAAYWCKKLFGSLTRAVASPANRRTTFVPPSED